jgi:triosephosphate isomerase
MKNFLIAGNWKMNTTFKEAIDLVENVIKHTDPLPKNIEVLFCPPFVWLQQLSKLLKNTNNYLLGAQNCYYKDNGAFTGEISVLMLKELGISYVIIGHSERRTIFGENDELINLKLKSLLKYNIIPILCIGETLEQRNSNQTNSVLELQINNAFKDLSIEEISKIVIAYEPVWAIGTGISATDEQAEDAHKFIRNFLITNYDKLLENNKILYGGSLNDKNASSLLKMPNIDGGLIGGASLKVNSFVEIINIAKSLV